MLKRNFFLYILIALLSPLTLLAGTPVEDFVSALSPGKCALLVVDLKTGQTIASYNSESSLTPASITKCITVASTLSKSGPHYRYHTKCYATGPIKDGIIEGNLLIVGAGDPSLGATVEPKTPEFTVEIVQELLKMKITGVRGKIITDSSIFPGPATHPTWGSGDLNTYYGTGCHGLNYQRNATGKSAVKNPQAILVKNLSSVMAANGITLYGNNMEGDKPGKLIADHVSPPISEIMRSCMMRSDNLYAEALLRTLALLYKKPASTQNGVEIETNFWREQGAPMQGVNLVDGSGLSRSNKFTPAFLTFILRKMAPNDEYVSFFPLAGQEGTMKNLFKNTRLDSYVALKTGTMRGVRCFAGYKVDEDFAPTHSIVIMTNEAPGSPGTVNKATEQFLLRVFFNQ